MERDGNKRTGTQRVLIAGGGVAALEAALALRDSAAGRVAVELLSPEPHFWYKPLSVAAPFELGKVMRFELDGLARRVGASFTLGALAGIDESRHVALTSRNTEIAYDMLLVACGALPFPAVPGALMFRGPADIGVIGHLLEEIAGGDVHSVAFVIPWGAVWSLPAYELVLLTATHLREQGLEDVDLSLVTPEVEPLQLFGSPASEAARELLAENGVHLRASAYAGEFADGRLALIPNGSVSVDRVVALPRLEGPPIDGLPQTVYGFVPVDSQCRVHGMADVFAAGDVTSFTVKQGGIATQQADVAAAAIAVAAGADVALERFRPVLRGLLLTGADPRFLRRELGVEPQRQPEVEVAPLWWPPAKIVGRHLAPFLASLIGDAAPPEHPPLAGDAMPVETELDVGGLARYEAARLPLGRELAAEEEASVLGAMFEPLVVAPEDTLGEVAELMLEHDATAAAVAQYGRLIGIVTRGDLLHAYAARAHPSEARVRPWMTAEPVTVAGTARLDGAVALMREYHIDHLVVVEGERPIGMLHIEDAVRDVALPIGLGF